MNILTQCSVIRHTHCVSAIQDWTSPLVPLEAEPPKRGLQQFLPPSKSSPEGAVPPQYDTADQLQWSRVEMALVTDCLLAAPLLQVMLILVGSQHN